MHVCLCFNFLSGGLGGRLGLQRAKPTNQVVILVFVLVYKVDSSLEKVQAIKFKIKYLPIHYEKLP